MFRFIYFFLILLSILSCNKKNYRLEDKNGNNNTFETAQIISKDGIKGSIVKGQKDYYYFNVNKEEIIDFDISNLGDKAITMTLCNYKTNIVKVISEFENTNENTRAYTIQTNDKGEVYSSQIMKGVYFDTSENTEENKYYIIIESKNDNTEYSFVLKKREYNETDEKEPNDIISQSQIIDVNSENRLYTIDGYYSQVFNPKLYSGDLKNMEIDSYKVTNSSFNTYSISIELSGVPSVDASIRLYDNIGNFIANYDLNNVGDGETVEKLVLYPYMSYYFVLVSERAVLNIPYRVSVLAKPYDKYTEDEPNNKDTQAQNLEFNKTYKGAIDYSYDRDYYTFNVPIQSSVKLSYFLIDSQAINLRISNENYGIIATMPQNDDEYTTSLKQGKYYLIFERDTTKEKWVKGSSKIRNYEFSMAISNEISGYYEDLNYLNDYYTNDYNNYYNNNDVFYNDSYNNQTEYNNDEETNTYIILRDEDYNAEYYHYNSEDSNMINNQEYTNYGEY
ncbi:peptidase [Brachyspira sp. SAP_772]|uniref:peptidase n=1 Tax=Brachyspira sp. SAP_772 TaxID=2608385 RepID=UPI0018DF9FA7|nr:peptidase [Brachyspira sp. SAP_772]